MSGSVYRCSISLYNNASIMTSKIVLERTNIMIGLFILELSTIISIRYLSSLGGNAVLVVFCLHAVQTDLYLPGFNVSGTSNDASLMTWPHDPHSEYSFMSARRASQRFLISSFIAVYSPCLGDYSNSTSFSL